MNFLTYSIIGVFAVGFLSHCKPKDSSDTSESLSDENLPARNEKISVSGSNASGQEGKNYKDTPGFAMNRNDITHSLLTQLKPDWLVIGSPVVAEAPASKDEIPNWKGLERASLTKSSPDIVTEVGGLKLPDALAATQWSAASFNADQNHLLMVPLEMTEPAYLFKVKDGEILVDSREEVPSINYDDKRRWFIQWETWISDSEIVGVFNEEDISGHVVTRSGIYLYNVDSRELRAVDLPYGFISGYDPSMEIVGVSPDGLLIKTTDGEKAVSLRQ